jgi:hypothetical protein
MLGLPARVAVGFTSGTKESDGLWHVTGKEAHAWPEVYLSGYGWVAFEPTPGRGLPGAEDYTNVPAAQAADTTATTVPDATAATDSTEPAPDTVAPAPPAPVSSSPSGPRIVVLGILLTLGAAYLVGVPLAKRRRRRLRRAAARSPAERVLVAWEESAEAMAATGLARRPDETAPEYAHRVCRAAGPAGAGLVRLADDSSAAAWSAGGVALEVAVRAEAEALGIATDLRAQSTRRERVRTALDPRPLLGRPARPPSPARDVNRAA